MTYQLNRFLQNQEQEQIQGPKSPGGIEVTPLTGEQRSTQQKQK